MDNGVYLLLGSNLGNREQNLSYVLHSLQNMGNIVTASAIYKTQAWGNTLQPDFLNQVVQITYDQSPQQLLSELLALESHMGRLRNEKWGPRIIDIDILFFGEQIINEENLIIPHPRIETRKFTLQPLVEIASKLIHPVLNKNCHQLLKECIDNSTVELYKKKRTT